MGEVLEPRVFRGRLWKQDLQFVWARYAAAKPSVRGFLKNKQGETPVDGNIFVDMLPHLYMVEKA
jgi:hypothetical protein